LRFARQFAVYVWVIVFEERAEVWSWRESDAFVVNYDRLIKIMDDQHGGAKGVVAKLPYASITAFDEAAVHELPEALEAIADLPGPLLVSTSRHAPRKGVDAFIRVLARLRDEGVDFRAALVGPGELLELHRELVRDLDLGDRVILPGRVPEVSPYLQHADVFVFPSIAEGSGSMSVIEALQFGVPVVSCSVDGMVEDLTDGEDAVMVETGSVDDLHRGLKQLIDDSELRARIAAGGRELYARRFSAEAMTDALSGLYAELGLEPVRAD
jgi:glycosyltransferase involved in cell wall biosynthesis